jgi:hypothetical protein
LKPFNRLPLPFQTIIPNATAIAESTNPERTHASFQKMYEPKFAALYEQVTREILRRVQPGQAPKEELAGARA